MAINIIVIHGPNLNLLGLREPDIYGSQTLEEINNNFTREADQLGVKTEFYQSNHEGNIVDKIQESREKADLIIINAAAFTHYSYAIRDALSAINIPVIEVHLSNIYKREEFRHHSVIAPIAIGQVTGFGYLSYIMALRGGLEYLKGKESQK